MKKNQYILVKVGFKEEKTKEEFPSVKDEPEPEDVIVLDDDDSLEIKDDIVFLVPPLNLEPAGFECSNSIPKVQTPNEKCGQGQPGIGKCSPNHNEGSLQLQLGAQINRKKAKRRGEDTKDDWSEFPYRKKVEVKSEDVTSSSVPVQRYHGCGRPRKYSSNEERLKARTEKRRQKWATMDPEKKAEYLRKCREYKRKVKASLTPLECDPEMLKTKGESERQRIAEMQMASERREHFLMKSREYQRNRRKKIMADKEKAEEYKRKHNIQQFLQKQARLASMTEEEKAELRRKEKEKREKAKMNMTEERKKRYKNRKYFRHQAKLAEMTREEREERTRKNTEYARNWRASLTGEKRQRYLEYVRKKSKESMERHNKKPGYHPSSENYERFKEYQRMRTATETPEERQKRLRRYKVNQAVRKLKKDLENEGVPRKEIDAKAKELKERMWAEPLPPPEKISTYTPRLKEKGDCSGASDSPQFVFKRRSRRGQSQSKPPPPSSSTNENSHSMTDMTVETANSETNPSITGQREEFNYDSDSRLDDYQDGADFEDEDDFQDDTTDTAPVEVENESSATNITELPAPPINQKSSPAPAIECPHCIFSFPEKSDLTAHVISEHPKKCWKCPFCKLILLSPAELKEHFQSHHTPKVPVKSVTSTKAVSSGATTTTSKNSISRLFTCMKCDPLISQFGNQKDLNEHVRSQHPKSYWPCLKCGLLKYSERTLRTHEKVCSSGSGSASVKAFRMENKGTTGKA